MQRARIAIEIQAGVMINRPLPELTKRFVIPSEVWYGEGEWAGQQDKCRHEIQRIYDEALAYQAFLYNPAQVNWVQTTWIYF
jgi:hypothetical protein